MQVYCIIYYIHTYVMLIPYPFGDSDDGDGGDAWIG